MMVDMYNPSQIGVASGDSVGEKAAAAGALVAGATVGGIPASFMYGLSKRLTNKYARAAAVLVGNVALAYLAGYVPGTNVRVGMQAAFLGTGVGGAVVEATGFNLGSVAAQAEARGAGATVSGEIGAGSPSMIPALSNKVGAAYADFVGAEYGDEAGALPPSHLPDFVVAGESNDYDYTFNS